jgi:hypothetical protein
VSVCLLVVCKEMVSMFVILAAIIAVIISTLIWRYQRGDGPGLNPLKTGIVTPSPSGLIKLLEEVTTHNKNTTI